MVCVDGGNAPGFVGEKADSPRVAQEKLIRLALFGKRLVRLAVFSRGRRSTRCRGIHSDESSGGQCKYFAPRIFYRHMQVRLTNIPSFSSIGPTCWKLSRSLNSQGCAPLRTGHIRALVSARLAAVSFMIGMSEFAEEFRTDRFYLWTFRDVVLQKFVERGDFGGVLFKKRAVSAKRVRTSASHSGGDRTVCLGPSSNRVQKPRPRGEKGRRLGKVSAGVCQ